MADKQVVIIGNGVAGITTARHLRKRSQAMITVISAESKHFFSRTALMYIYMGHMKYEHTKPYSDDFWAQNKIELLQTKVEQILPGSKAIKLAGGQKLNYDKLVIASGSITATYDWKGMQLKGVQGLYSLQDLHSMDINTNGIEHAVVVGGGLIGVEMAEMLHSRGIHVTILIREDRFWGNVLPKEEGELIGRHLSDQGIELLYYTELNEIIGGEHDQVKAIKTSSGQTINCDFVGICTGVKPNVQFLQDSGLEIDRGILVDEYLQTNLSDIYAAGDCAQLRNPQKGRKPIEAVWYVGKMMGEVLGATLAGSQTKYQPGQWFNSAKFFQIEYQTYGQVPANSEHPSLYWEDSDKEKALRLVYRSDNHQLIGMHAFGIRLSHPQCDQWLNTGIEIAEVIEELSQANFDPEFYENPFPLIQALFKKQLKQTQI
jgi:NAD(P)H-nitrite reductase large subunit